MLAELSLLARYTVTREGAVYAIPFRVYRAEDVAVTFSTNGRTETALTLGKDYSVQVLGTGGAELALAAGVVGAVVPAGAVLAIASAVPATQEADFSSTATVDTGALETQLDREVQMIQQLKDGLSRAVMLPAASNESPGDLLEDIFAARDSAADSATSAKGSANAAADSARAAAGSAAIATEQREAACICAQEAQAARDVAIAQNEAANTLMEAELGKVNAIVAANRTDQQAAVTAARAWAEKDPDTPVDYDEEGNPRYSARHWARNAQQKALNPDNETVMVDDDGVLHALGGNLLLNSEELILESGVWTAPVTGWYMLDMYSGGQCGRVSLPTLRCIGGGAGFHKSALVYLTQGQEVSVVIGAGAPANSSQGLGGATSFGDIVCGEDYDTLPMRTDTGQVWSPTFISTSTFGEIQCSGAGRLGGYPSYPTPTKTQAQRDEACNALGHQGSGGAAVIAVIEGKAVYGAGAGGQGSVLARWHNPAKAAGPLPEPALLSARSMAPRTATAPATVNLYDPETGQGSVWREEDAEAKLAEGLITQEAWQEICAAKAAEERAEWLASPETEEERFTLLQQACAARLAETDKLTLPDYPLSDEARAEVNAYRKAIRELNHQPGAPWDGGGELTPWPEMPVVSKVQE